IRDFHVTGVQTCALPISDYLERQGVEGLVADLQGFARRRPGAFLGGALLAGLAVGRLAKASGSASRASAQSGPEPGPVGTGASDPPALSAGPPPAVPPSAGSLPGDAPPNGAPIPPHPGV